MAIVQVVLRNKPGERQRLVAALHDYARLHHLPAGVLQAADLALEEHLTNVMHHAYADAQDLPVQVRLALEPERLLIEVTDEGQAFNPLEAPEIDPSLPLKQKPVGGLGIHLIRHCMDELRYERQEGKNILRMWKRLDCAAKA